MPRTSKGAKLWFDKARDRWSISDGGYKRRTGFLRHEVEGAEAELAKYIALKHTITSTPDPLVVDVLSVYYEEVVIGLATERDTTNRLKKLKAWWGPKLVSEITTASCKAYFSARGPYAATVRTELAFLTAAINHWRKSRQPIAKPVVWLPPKTSSRVRWLTRSEAAKFLWASRRHPHMVRFFILGWYTGSRKTVLLKLRWDQVDFDTSIIHRKPPGARQTKKRAPPVRAGRRLMSHLTRWKKFDDQYNIETIVWNQDMWVRPVKPLSDISRPWIKSRTSAKLSSDVTPHTLRHSRATHLLRQGVNPYEAAQSLGMSLRQLETVYGHFIPAWQSSAAEAK